MSTLLFIKMNRVEGCLERLLAALRSKGAEIQELSAKVSLDRSTYFVRLGLSDTSSRDHLERELAAMKDIHQVEILPAQS